MNSENKNSFFFVHLIPDMDTSFGPSVEKTVTLIEDRFEPVLSRLNANAELSLIHI